MNFVRLARSFDKSWEDLRSEAPGLVQPALVRESDFHLVSTLLNIDIHHETGPDSRFLTSQIWINDLEEDIKANGVEIVELNTSENSQTSNEDPPENPYLMNHPWSSATSFNNSEDTFKANRQARLTRRLRNRNRFHENGALDSEFDSSIYFDNTWTPDTADVEAFNQTCFTILDKLSALELESTPEDFEESGNEASREVMLEAGWKGKGETGEELVSYGSGLDGEKHTIWIYSFKNRRMLSDIDFELVKIPSRESVATSSSTEIDEELNANKSARVPSPIPAAYIQRLDLSLGATLPNVTEVTEPKSSESLIRKKHVPTRKPANSWCLDISEKATITENKLTNIVNWMALSPRERRRHSRPRSEAPIQLQPVTEVSKDDGKERNRELFETEITELADFQAKKPNLEKIEIETLDETKFFKPPSQINSQSSSANSKREKFRNNATYLISPFPPRRVNLDLSYKAQHESEQTKLKNAVRGAWSDRGHYKVQKPRITVDKPFPLSMSPITRPIETLDSNDWIAEHEPKSYCQDRRQVTSAGDRLMIRNMSLLKPAEWKSYSPVTGSRLSIDLGSELQPKKSLLQRCFGCFKCCNL